MNYIFSAIKRGVWIITRGIPCHVIYYNINSSNRLVAQNTVMSLGGFPFVCILSMTTLSCCTLLNQGFLSHLNITMLLSCYCLVLRVQWTTTAYTIRGPRSHWWRPLSVVRNGHGWSSARESSCEFVEAFEWYNLSLSSPFQFPPSSSRRRFNPFNRKPPTIPPSTYWPYPPQLSHPVNPTWWWECLNGDHWQCKGFYHFSYHTIIQRLLLYSVRLVLFC